MSARIKAMLQKSLAVIPGAHNRRSRWPHTSDCIFSPV